MSYELNKLTRHREIWKKKKIIRDIYTGWYKQILKDLNPGKGRTFELGAGSGNFKEFKPEVAAADIEYCPWLDITFDAHAMPIKENTAANIVMIDVLHHLADPVGFFHEAAQTLETGGRIILVEPFPTPFSLFIYKRFHPEPFIMDIDYFKKTSSSFKKDPWEANQAAAYLLFFKHWKTFLNHFWNEFKIVKRKRMSCILYPASGGFENKAMIPDALIPLFKLLEIILMPFRRLLAFRCYIVLEKIDTPCPFGAPLSRGDL
ncbi:MAG: methyltransferase domain-containing protein [Candidatus Aminicenantes bacterium]|nr:methyltransferase domain-containing protein [Candidatus Aminicenantes bacterium]NIM81051.1 methyltransferase domain-containing protein [Candidatus Aminicenantes bacterium]NIN20428.1 methyltransferase domain-containing protein [Candidatus Aminicenantes bacterium]NIN44201.1 methyltransferase domain-containing protein [Candidatus Aminicenantes bacterium]NIN87019.1 methyltransferase domain-containing protein [Candidatus Aminicenantes bacterium]